MGLTADLFFREASSSALAGFQNWSPLEREIGHVCVTNLKHLRLREIVAIRMKNLISLKFFITNVFAYVKNRFVVNMYFGIIKYNLSVWIC